MKFSEIKNLKLADQIVKVLKENGIMIHNPMHLDIISRNVAMLDSFGATIKDIAAIITEVKGMKFLIDVTSKNTEIQDLSKLPKEIQILSRFMLGEGRNPYQKIVLEDLIDFNEAQSSNNFDKMLSNFQKMGVNVITSIDDLPADMPEELKQMVSSLFVKNNEVKKEVDQTPKHENNFNWDDSEIDCIIESQVGHKNYECFKGLDMVVCQIKTGKIITEIIIDRNYEIKDIRIKK